MSRKTPLEWKKYFESEQFESEYYYGGNDLGCTLLENETRFRIWAPTAEKVTLNLYKSGNFETEDKIGELELQKAEKGTWTAVADSRLTDTYYTYTVTANGENHETQDVYSRACGVNGRRSMTVDLNSTHPQGWQEDNYRYDSSCLPVIYELHIKDFSFAESSGIPKEYRGKYKAFTVQNSSLNGEGQKPTCLAYLKKLGITHVHLLPSYDFGSVDEAGDFDTQFNWGYDPVNYNVPEGSYATDAFDGSVRIREFKEMVQALHEAGIGVIMDVVYNHTYSLDSCFQKTVPYYYYRVDENGELSNGSICGNDTASERAMYRKYMVDSVCYWAKEYHIDGFRFDLMGLHDVETMNEIRKALNELPKGKDILMYGEPWAGSDTAMKTGTIPALKKNVALLDAGIAIFNDDTRDAVKGSVFYEERPGFVNGKKELESEICSAVRAWCGGEGNYQPHNPGQIITYVSAHDNWSLWDKLNYTLKENPDFAAKDEQILQANRFAAGIYMTCLGNMFWQAGEEAARTKLGEGDSFSSPPQLNALDWERMYQFEDLMQYYKGMLSIRKQFKAYQMRGMEAFDLVKIYGHHCGKPTVSGRDSERVLDENTEVKNANEESARLPYWQKNVVKFSVDAADETEKWKRLWVVYAAREDVAEAEILTVSLPEAKRLRLSDGITVLDVPEPVAETDKVTVMAGGVSVFVEPWQ